MKMTKRNIFKTGCQRNTTGFPVFD